MCKNASIFSWILAQKLVSFLKKNLGSNSLYLKVARQEIE